MLLQLNIDRVSSELDPDINHSLEWCFDKVPFGKEIFYLHLGKIGGCSITADLAKVVGRSNIFSNQAGEQQPQNSGRVMTTVIEFFCRLIVSISLKKMRVSILLQACLRDKHLSHVNFKVTLTMVRRPLDHVLSMYHECTQYPNPIIMRHGVGVGEPGFDMPNTFGEWVHAWVEKPREDYEAHLWEYVSLQKSHQYDQPPTAVHINESALCHHQQYRCHQCTGIHQLCGHPRGIP